MKMLGVFGKYADVDLSTGKISNYEIPEDWHTKHMGGRGIAARILIKELVPKIDPLSEHNILVFAAGPFQGLNMAGGGRFLVMGKSPKTWTINDSFCGGRFGHILGRSGFDGLIVRGKAEEPVYILIDDGKVFIHSAKDLWGLNPKEVEEYLGKRQGELSVACIGKAGENMVMAACIMVDHTRAVGRPGYGAVMGSKNLKAIAVRGTQNKQIADEEKLKSLRPSFAKGILQGVWEKRLAEYGTAEGVENLHQLGILPTKNFATGMFIDFEQITGERLVKSGLLVDRDTCPGCPVRCKRVVKGSFNGEKFEPTWGGPEYETIGAVGSFCLNGDLAAICLLNQKCNQYGLDTISTGVLIAYLMEATEKGLLRGEDAIRWGDARTMVKLVDRIAHRQGIGEWVARGAEYLASRVGDSSFMMAIKGQEIPMHEPRGKLSLAVYYAMTPRGGQHMEGTHDPNPPNPELRLGENERLSWNDKARITGTYLNLRSFANSLVLCAFTASLAGDSYQFPAVREMVKAVTGLTIDVEEMLRIGERNYGLLRFFAEKEGYSRRDDDLPKRFKQRLPESGFYIDDAILQKTIDEYYRIFGYGIYGPTNERLRELGLEDLIS
ncbi:aldehyde ferredoxin oxidoreductase family protein [Candidatus Aerophobetes bacterium]|nr:aldehyde ferredoxin oxidoreductase family protein [Candidatus Aerophobetes bacterium]